MDDRDGSAGHPCRYRVRPLAVGVDVGSLWDGRLCRRKWVLGRRRGVRCSLGGSRSRLGNVSATHLRLATSVFVAHNPIGILIQPSKDTYLIHELLANTHGRAGGAMKQNNLVPMRLKDAAPRAKVRL